MWPFKKPKPLDAAASQSAKPIHLVEPDVEQLGAKWFLTVRINPSKVSRILSQNQSVKKFELDDMGMAVWEMCDGKTSVRQIIVRLAKAHGLNLRESEVATVTFLRTLMRKGLLGIPIQDKKKVEKKRD